MKTQTTAKPPTPDLKPKDIIQWVYLLEREACKVPYWHLPKNQYHVAITFAGQTTGLRRSLVPIDTDEHVQFYPDELMNIDPSLYEALSGETLEMNFEMAVEILKLKPHEVDHLRQAWGDRPPDQPAPEILRDNVPDIGIRALEAGCIDLIYPDTLPETVLFQALYTICNRLGEDAVAIIETAEEVDEPVHNNDDYCSPFGITKLKMAELIAQRLNILRARGEILQ